MNELALFAGAGGGILGGRLLGWRTVCAVELDPYAASVLLSRQNDGTFPPFPVWDDVSTFDGRAWRGRVEVISGGFPCQDISVAGKGAGIDGERSGLWSEFARIIREVRPRFLFVENSPALTSRGLGAVLGDLASMGFDAEWGVLGAHSVGAPHKRDRIWIVAADSDRELVRDKSKRNKVGRFNIQGRGQTKSSNDGIEEPLADTDHSSARRVERGIGETLSGEKEQRDFCGSDERNDFSRMADTDRAGRQEQRWPFADATEHSAIKRRGDQTRTKNNGDLSHSGGKRFEGRGAQSAYEHLGPRNKKNTWWETEPNVGRVANGVAARVDRLKAIGNGQVSAVAALAWHVLIDRLENPK